MDSEQQAAATRIATEIMAQAVRPALELLQGTAGHVQALELLVLGMLAAHPARDAAGAAFGKMATATIAHTRNAMTTETRPFLDALEAHAQRLQLAIQTNFTSKN